MQIRRVIYDLLKGGQTKPRGWFGALLLALGALLTAGCSDFVDRDQTAIAPERTVLLEPGHTVGQTFVARHGGLSGVEFWLKPQQGSAGVLRLHLRHKPQSSTDLALAELPLEAVRDSGFYRFSFPPDNRSHGAYRYVFLELDGVGAVQVGASPGESYIDGASYWNHEPLDAQLAFQLIYNPWGMMLEVGWATMEGIKLLIISAILYLVPGYALLAWFDPHPGSWFVRMALAAGLTLAIYPLLLLWTDLVGLHLGSLYALGTAILGTIVLVWRYRHWHPRQGWETLRAWASSDALWPDLSLVVILAMIFGVRLLVVRTLDAPMWGDSYQHAVIAQLLVDNGGLFDSWAPYTPYQSLTVHFGFPTLVSIFSWMTGIEIARATLLTGQLVNGLAILTLYPLAVYLARGNRWAGVGAVLVAGMLSPMPAYYVNWGRFAQMSGQALLPVALCLLLDSVDRERLAWKPILLAGLALGGMALHYYRMPFYYATFVLAWLIGWGLPEWRVNWRRWLSAVGRMSLVVGGTLFLVLPWIRYIAGGRLANSLRTGAFDSTVSAWESVLSDYQIWRDVAWYVPWPLLGFALLSLIWALVRRQWAVVACALWVVGLAALVAGRLIQIPGSNLMENFAVLIALYIPVGLMTGWLIGEVARWLRGWSAAIVFLALAIWFAREQVTIVDVNFALVTRPDRQAMAWIQENIPADARFLVQGFRIYGGSSAVGADAGWWIPLLARRENTMPPQYALLNEAPTEPDYSQRVVDLVSHLEKYPPVSPEGIARLCEWGITHVYIGQGQGKVGSGAVQLFPPEVMTDSPAFRLVYRQDRVLIFAMNREICERAIRNPDVWYDESNHAVLIRSSLSCRTMRVSDR